MTTMITIVGSGAIGGLCAAGAQQASAPYRLLARSGSTALQSVKLQDGHRIRLKTVTDNPTVTLTANDVLILPLKVFQLSAAMTYWQPLLSTQTPVILLHNGMGGMELANQFLPDNPVYLATTSHGALKTAPTEVRHTGKGQTMLGLSPCHRGSAKLNTHITTIMECCIGPVTWREDILFALWQKLAINCAINPLTAMHDIRNGELIDAAHRTTIEAIIKEVCNVAIACGVELDFSSMLAQVFDVINLTADNYSSMHQDVTHHRPTEIDAITGYIIAQAKKKGIDVPINTLLYNTIKRR
ncbi:MAG: 2-dehydropantoate 2-reductase [Alteromonadaceae bacterium]|nr:2-dehydropantoate 2-reductase [Alteromonadaceae bacterium]